MDLKYVGANCGEKIIVNANGIKIGSGDFTIMAGPCSIEGREMIIETACFVKQKGAKILRGGAFKPRTSPYSFQGLFKEGLEYMKEASKASGLPVVSEVMDTRDVEMIVEYVDMLQIGSRNMQNFELLREVGKANRPILLKRGLASTIEEFLFAAEYIANEGNLQIVLCERGIRTFESYTRNTLDISAIPVLKKLSRLPVIFDPSHGTGMRDLILPMTLAGLAAGADGAIIEVHPNPACALSDGEQSLNFEEYARLSNRIEEVKHMFSDMRNQ